METILNQSKKLFFGKKVLIFGLGLQGGGEGVLNFLLRTGAKVRVTDLRPKNDFGRVLKKFSKKTLFILGRHRKEDIRWADIIVKNPSVPKESPFIKYAKKLEKPTMSETRIFFELVPREKIIGITGTKGKTTTASLLAHLLSAKFNVCLVGNIPGQSALASLLNLKKTPDFFVYELSSFNLEGLKKSPKYAVITNIFPDHLNRYKNFKEYKKTKENIFRYQKKGDRLWRGNENIAQKIALFLGVSNDEVKKRLSSFRPPRGRIEILGKINGIIVINDTTATNPEAALFSVRQIQKLYKIKSSQIILIAGGENKNLNYADFSKKIEGLKKVILIPGSASDKIKSSNVLREKTLPLAVKTAFKIARSGGYIIFSPGAASFNAYKNEFDRGEAFKKALKAL